MRKRKCGNCGVARQIMVKATLQEFNIEMTYKWLCFPCLLRTLGLVRGPNFRDYVYELAMKEASE